jgi:hypothetical protein
MRNKEYKFGHDLLINKGTLHVEKGALFGYIPAFVEGILLTLRTSQSPRIRYNRRNFDCDQSLIKRTLIVEQRKFSAVSRFPLEGFFWNLFLALSMHAL